MDVMQTKLSIPVRRFSEGRFTGGNSMREDPKARSCIIHGTASAQQAYNISTSSPIRCYRCNGSNHFTRNCPNFLKVSNATRPLTNPQDKLYRIDGARAVELIIRILGKPVRFLADTDVGINVIKRLYTDGHKISRNVRKLTGISHLILTTTENCEIDCDIRTYIFAIVR
ncbi:hypothetical protein HZH68_001161 [Vespula germanica]|uniref:CCHC-type domain-containing protein n=1 Tax=Vespula germanica TaxID=30212 RepID=A0A834NUX1_VESGE|nr:hypothetical protein HZH68_001161 [Vespula germanica]